MVDLHSAATILLLTVSDPTTHREMGRRRCPFRPPLAWPPCLTLLTILPRSSHTLQGDDLSWLHLMLDGVLPSKYGLPANRSDQTSEASAQADVAATLTIAEAAVGDHIDLLDPEGVTLASLTVAEVDGDNVGGPVERRSGFSIVDHVDLRLSPDASRAAANGPPQPRGHCGSTVRSHSRSVRPFAPMRERTVHALLEIVPVPTGHETSRSANAPVRLALAHTTRDDADRVIVVPWPSHVEPGPTPSASGTHRACLRCHGVGGDIGAVVPVGPRTDSRSTRRHRRRSAEHLHRCPRRVGSDEDAASGMGGRARCRRRARQGAPTDEPYWPDGAAQRAVWFR